ncbi:hypothetical protein HA402_001705 [Bradysia odoriphaga]|nr:hypothetical protein HA402_001705 [Bradysia odoriphaga]
MKIKKNTTANIKNPAYNEKHQIFVGTQTGSFKKPGIPSSWRPSIPNATVQRKYEIDCYWRKSRQNNLKVWDLETKTKVFTSKNLPNDYLELEAVWDYSDIVFVDAHQLATCSRHGYLRVYDTRKQRRPVLEYVNPKEQIAYGCATGATVHENTLLAAGSASGIVRAFDTRKMKTIVHTYKGFTGSVTDIVTDNKGKYLFTSCLDRFVRVHSVLQYQCYVKSKATQILMRTYDDQPDCVMSEDSNSNETDDNQQSDDDSDDGTESERSGSDSEYEEMFQQMPTVDEEKQERLNKKRKTQESIKISRKSPPTTQQNKENLRIAVKRYWSCKSVSKVPEIKSNNCLVSITTSKNNCNAWKRFEIN